MHASNFAACVEATIRHRCRQGALVRHAGNGHDGRTDDSITLNRLFRRDELSE